MKKLIVLSLSLLLLAAALTACVAPKKETTEENKPKLETIVFTEPVRGYHWAPAYLAQTLGYFAEEGLQADFRTVTGADASAPVFAGEAQFGLRGVEMALMSAEAGQGCKILLSTTAHYPYQLIGANESYQSVESLRGKVIAGGQGAASAPQAFINAIIKQAGMTGEDASVISMASSGYIAAIKNGDIQAAVSTNPWASKTLLDNGGVVIVDGADEAAMESLMGSRTYELFMVFATDEYIQYNHDTVQKVVNAMTRAMQWMENHSAEEIARQLEPLFQDRFEELLYSAQVDKQSGLSNPTGYHTDSGYAAALALTKLSGGISSDAIPADQVYDESFLKTAWESLASKPQP